MSNLSPFCHKCGWRKGGPDSWNGRACKCGMSAPPLAERLSSSKFSLTEEDKLHALLAAAYSVYLIRLESKGPQ